MVCSEVQWQPMDRNGGGIKCKEKLEKKQYPNILNFCDTCGKKLDFYETCVEEDYFLEVGIGEIRSSKKRAKTSVNVECMTKIQEMESKDERIRRISLYNNARKRS